MLPLALIFLPEVTTWEYISMCLFYSEVYVLIPENFDEVHV